MRYFECHVRSTTENKTPGTVLTVKTHLARIDRKPVIHSIEGAPKHEINSRVFVVPTYCVRLGVPCLVAMAKIDDRHNAIRDHWVAIGDAGTPVFDNAVASFGGPHGNSRN